MRYVRSTVSGAVLPYNKVLARRPDVQVLTPEECDAHDELHKPKPKATKKVAKKKASKKKATKKFTFSKEAPKEDSKEIDEVVAALAID